MRLQEAFFCLQTNRCPGPSSNISFLRHLSVTGISGPHQSRRPHPHTPRPEFSGVGFANFSRQPSPVVGNNGHSFREKPVNLFALPPPQKTLELVQKYFLDTGLLFPYIYPPTFFETLQHALGDDQIKIRRTWLGLLNMMLAMVKITAAPDENPAESRIGEANLFYQRALGLCGNEMLRGTTTEVGEFLYDMKGLPRMRVLMAAVPKSSIPAPYGSIPPRYTEVRTGLDNSWSCR